MPGPDGRRAVPDRRGHQRRARRQRPGCGRDVIQSAGQERTPDTQALSRALAVTLPRDQVTLTVARGTGHLTVQATLGELPAADLADGAD